MSVETSQAVHDTLWQATGTAGRLFEGQILTIHLALLKTPSYAEGYGVDARAEAGLPP